MVIKWIDYFDPDPEKNLQESYQHTLISHTVSAIPRQRQLGKESRLIARWYRFRGVFQRCVETTLEFPIHISGVYVTHCFLPRCTDYFGRYATG